MPITIRDAIPSDCDAVLELMRELAQHEGLSQYFLLTSEELARLCFSEPARLEVIVAVAEEGIVGYATCMAQLSPWAGREYLFVDDVYVASSQRRSGVGSLLMKRIGEIAMQRDMDVRWHVERENTRAQTFYRGIGAELREKFIAYWLKDAIAAYTRR